MGKYVHARTCVYNVNYHIIWCVKYRRKVLTEEIAARLCQITKAIGDEKGFSVELCEVGSQDHVHCFVSAPPKLSITEIVTWLKGISGRHLMMEYPELSKQLWHGHLWNGSYFVETIGSVGEDAVRKYIERQQNVQR